MAAALALLFIFPGIPCIFYGTEFFMEGGYDPDCRRCMDWEGYTEGRYEESVELIRLFANLRKEYELSSMDTVIRAEGKVLIVERMNNDVKLTLSVNMTENSDEFGYDLDIERR